MLVQLQLFESPSEIDILENQVEELRKNQDKLRKALFARHGELAKKYLEIHDRLEIIERHICQWK